MNLCRNCYASDNLHTLKETMVRAKGIHTNKYSRCSFKNDKNWHLCILVHGFQLYNCRRLSELNLSRSTSRLVILSHIFIENCFSSNLMRSMPRHIIHS
ncbi:uncharacterized protein LOC135688580 [Rhopilema esculentum]|uniref:uncharacterized protein LOC135688580 n=1 Tax=Rhopilema esculentum TaxID=499914 RepID=UPI0031E23B68